MLPKSLGVPVPPDKFKTDCESCGKHESCRQIEIDGEVLTVCDSCYVIYQAWKETTGRPTVKEFLEKVREIESRPNK